MASGAARHRGLGTASVLVTASEAAPWPAVLSRWPSGTLPGSYPPPSRLLEPQVWLTCVCSARRLCPDRGWPGAGWGDLGRLGLPPWGSRYWLNVDQSAGRQVVAAGCVGSPFSHKALATGSTNTANWAGDAPALPAPPPPTHAAQRCPASCLVTRICAHSYSTTTHNRKAFWLPPGCCLLFSTRFRRHLLQETCQDPHKLSALRGPATLWLSHCVRVRAELSRCLSIPSVFPSQASPTRRPVSTGVERPPRTPSTGRYGKPQAPLQRSPPPGIHLAEAPGPARWHSRMGCVGEGWEGVRPQNLPRWRRPRARGPLLTPTTLAVLGLLGWLDGFLWLPRVGSSSCGGQPGARGREPGMPESPCSQANDMSAHTQRLVLPRGQSPGVRGGLSPGPVCPARPARLLQLSAPSRKHQGTWCWPGCSPCTCASLPHPRPEWLSAPGLPRRHAVLPRQLGDGSGPALCSHLHRARAPEAGQWGTAHGRHRDRGVLWETRKTHRPRQGGDSRVGRAGCWALGSHPWKPARAGSTHHGAANRALLWELVSGLAPGSTHSIFLLSNLPPTGLLVQPMGQPEAAGQVVLKLPPP